MLGHVVGHDVFFVVIEPTKKWDISEIEKALLAKQIDILIVNSANNSPKQLLRQPNR